jgi:hypothetical protein
LASVIGNVDDGDDIVHPGAFTKTLNENRRRVKHLWQHDANQPPTATIVELREVGRDDLPPETRGAFPDAKGGLVVKRTYLATPRGDEILAGIKAGAVTEMSFGYDAMKKDYSTLNGKSVRNLRELKLYETSDVQWGMNAATRAAKSATVTDLESLISDADGLATAIRVEIKAGRMISAANMEKLKRVMDALENGLEELETLLGAAEPPAQEAVEDSGKSKTLTVDGRGLLARLAIAERDLVRIGI